MFLALEQLTPIPPPASPPVRPQQKGLTFSGKEFLQLHLKSSEILYVSPIEMGIPSVKTGHYQPSLPGIGLGYPAHPWAWCMNGQMEAWRMGSWTRASVVPQEMCADKIEKIQSIASNSIVPKLIPRVWSFWRLTLSVLFRRLLLDKCLWGTFSDKEFPRRTSCETAQLRD